MIDGIADFLLYEVYGEDVYDYSDITHSRVDGNSVIFTFDGNEWIATFSDEKANPASRLMANGIALQYIG